MSKLSDPRLFVISAIAPILGDLQHANIQASAISHQGYPIPDDRLFLHASAISFHVREVPTSTIRRTPHLSPIITSTDTLFVIIQRFRRTGTPKRLNVTLCAPLPRDFTELCIRAGIEVPQQLVEGGLLVDGHPTREIPDVDGIWVPS